MARPKTGKPRKRRLNLTVGEKTRESLTYLSEQRGMSISALVEELAANEAQNREMEPVIYAEWLPGPGEWKKCSHCHEDEFLPHLQHSYRCPNCGARMKRKENTGI